MSLTCLDTALAEVSTSVGAGLSQGGLIDVIAGLERVKRAISAVQAEATAAFATLVREEAAERGVPTAKRGASVAPQVALARRVSEKVGGRHVGAADALVRDLPHTLAALRSGVVEERTAYDVVREVFHLDAQGRRDVDDRMRKEYQRPGVSSSQICGSARALATEIDPSAAIARISAERRKRFVSVRAASHAMCWVSALVPLKDGIAMRQSLLTGARSCTHRVDEDGVERTEAQLMADLLVERVTGKDASEVPPVVVNVVMTEEAMFRQGDQSGSLVGYGPIPADHARVLVQEAAAEDRAWVRRIYTSPDGESLIGMDAATRLFPKSLATFLRLRDQRCATPFCNSYVQHVDHITPHRQGGATSADNGQGLCARCNYVKEIPGFTSTRDPVTGDTTLKTPTGHEYVRTPPPVLGHPTLPVEPVPKLVITRMSVVGPTKVA